MADTPIIPEIPVAPTQEEPIEVTPETVPVEPTTADPIPEDGPLDNATDPHLLEEAAQQIMQTAPSPSVEYFDGGVKVDGVNYYVNQNPVQASLDVTVVSDGIIYREKRYLDPVVLADELQYWVNRNESPGGSTGNMSVLNEVTGILRTRDK